MLRLPTILLIISLLSLSLPACNTMEGNTVTLTVFAAASLSESFEDLVSQFEASQPGVQVELVFAGSQQLAIQLREGAQADIFASANRTQMESLIEAGLVEADGVYNFATNRLVAIVPKDNPAGMDDLQNLVQPGRRLVLASPEVPVGQYSLDFLSKAAQDGELGVDFQANVLRNVVSYENDVKTVLAKVALGEADAGIVYSSDAGPDQLDRIIRIEIPDRWNIIALYPIAALAGSAQPELAEAFVAYILSAQGQVTLADHGFLPAAP